MLREQWTVEVTVLFRDWPSASTQTSLFRVERGKALRAWDDTLSERALSDCSI